MKTKKYNAGFTLVELLLVIAIIAILATVLFVSLGSQRERARVSAFKENARGLVTTFTACADGKGNIAATGALDGGRKACPTGGSGITANIPVVTSCNGTGNATMTQVTPNGDAWEFTANCPRTSGSCNATCKADGCTFAGTCD